MLPEVQAANPCRGVEEDRRARVADLIESVPFWTAVALLTLLDVLLFLWQNFYTDDELTREALQATELAISTLFVIELGLRCYAQDRDRLLCASNIFDTTVIILAFALSLVEVSNPILVARGARLLRFGAASTRCSRAARNTQRSAVEMRNFFTDARKSGMGMAARVAARAAETDVAPLFFDCRAVPELAALLETKPWAQDKDPRAARRAAAIAASSDGASQPALSPAKCPVLLAARTLKRAARAEIEKAEATDVQFRAHAARKLLNKKPPQGAAEKKGPLAAKTATSTTETNKATLAEQQTPLVAAAADDDKKPHQNITADPEAGDDDDDDDDEGNKPVRRVVTSSKALVAVLEHAVDAAKAKEAPPPRLLATVRNKGLGLVFLNRDI